MNSEYKQDLRVRRTEESIRRAFAEMLLEMPYEKITVTELSKRAYINKKTFYRHYAVLDDLLQEIQREFAEPFAQLTAGLRYPDDVDAITREFLMYSAKQGPLYDAVISSGMHDDILTKVLNEMGAERYGIQNHPAGWDDNEWSIYIAHVTSSQVRVYRQWVQDGRKVPVNRMVALGVRLICGGAYLERGPKHTS
ncbi:TetR/AcrR family transcriptional regulator [Slackia heliotrinireducens]|uniref:TetR/AcrR family transcriptional regulator n=1 Tax=Slackia heliotrinireducens TaxID=84110 RepID=UPI0033156DA0